MSHESELGGGWALFVLVCSTFLRRQHINPSFFGSKCSHTCFVECVDVDTATFAGKDTLEIARLEKKYREK